MDPYGRGINKHMYEKFLKVHKRENFYGCDFEFFTFS
jgi:hypothetical protein